MCCNVEGQTEMLNMEQKSIFALICVQRYRYVLMSIIKDLLSCGHGKKNVCFFGAECRPTRKTIPTVVPLQWI